LLDAAIRSADGSVASGRCVWCACTTCSREEVAVGYTTFRRYVQRELGWRKKQPTVRLDDPAPGQEAQIDFGLMGTITDEEAKARKLHVLIVTLSSSRYTFVWPTLRQTTEEVCAGFDAAWRFFGGVPRYTLAVSTRVS
jgi:transposase